MSRIPRMCLRNKIPIKSFVLELCEGNSILFDKYYFWLECKLHEFPNICQEKQYLCSWDVFKRIRAIWAKNDSGMFILRVVYSIFHRLSHIPLTIACQLRNEQVSCIFFSASSSSSLPLGPCNYSDYLAQTYRQDTNHSGSSNNNAKSHAAPLTQCQVTSVSESLSPVPLLHPWPFRPDFLHPARLRLWPFDQRRHTAKEMRRSK